MSITIKNRFNGEVIREFPGESLHEADLTGADLYEADLTGADL